MDPQPPASAGFSPGSLLSETFTIYSANFVAFTVIVALVHIPTLLARAVVGPSPFRQWVPLLLSFLAAPIGTAAITYGVFEHLRGERKPVGELLSVGFSQALAVLGVALLTGLCMGVGFALCILPGIFAAVLLAVAVPVAVQEKLGGMDALRRSASLTEGYRGDVFIVLFVIGLIAGGVALLSLMIFRTLLMGYSETARLMAQFVSIPVGALSSTAAAVMYYRLRHVKESAGLHDIAAVFD